MATITIRPTTNYGTGSYPINVYHTQTANGAATLHECVAELVADGDTTFIQASAGDAAGRVLFGYGSSSINSSDTINFLVASFVAADVGGKGGSTVNHVFESSFTSHSYHASPQTGSTSTYTTYQKTYLTNPATNLSWQKSELDDLKLGYEEGGTLGLKVTQFYVTIDYTPSGGGSPSAVKPIMMMLETDD